MDSIYQFLIYTQTKTLTIKFIMVYITNLNAITFNVNDIHICILQI